MRTQPAIPFAAGAAVAPRRFVKFSADNTVVQGAASTDDIIGVSDSLGADAAGKRCETYTSGDQVEVVYGGNVTRGKEVTSDADGKAVHAAPAAGATCRTAGIAMVSGVAGDIGFVRLAPSSKTTPA